MILQLKLLLCFCFKPVVFNWNLCVFVWNSKFMFFLFETADFVFFFQIDDLFVIQFKLLILCFRLKLAIVFIPVEPADFFFSAYFAWNRRLWFFQVEPADYFCFRQIFFCWTETGREWPENDRRMTGRSFSGHSFFYRIGKRAC